MAAYYSLLLLLLFVRTDQKFCHPPPQKNGHGYMNEKRKDISRAIKSLSRLRESGEAVTVTEAAEFLGVTRSAVSQLLTSGLLDTVTLAPIPAYSLESP